MRRLWLIFVVLAAVAPASAWADAGGAAAPDTSDVSEAGGSSTPPASSSPPVARLSAPSLGAPGKPAISVRFTGSGLSAVTARVVVLRVPGNAVAARIVLGSVPVGKTIAVPWRGGALPAGQYLVRVHAHDQWNRQLRRLAHASGKTLMTVKARPKPKPDPDPPADGGDGVFPVAGPYTWGDGIGVARDGHTHQGQDLAAARGTPVVEPTSGIVLYTDYQASAAGEYVVVAADNGYSYFFAHCIRHSTVVTPGQRVAPGTRLCSVGSTGGSTGPHLHFEVWQNGWRMTPKSTFIDPTALLKSWES